MNHLPSFLFDAWRWSEHSELQSLFQRLWNDLPKDGYKDMTLERLKRHLQLFLCNLYVSYYYEKPVAISTKSCNFSFGRYKQLHLKRIPFCAIYRFMKEQGLIEYKTGFKAFSANGNNDSLFGSTTRIWPSDILRREFSSLANFLPERESLDCIVLRDKNKNDVAFVENAFTANLRKELEFINQVFSSHYFQFNNSNIYHNLSINPFYYDSSSNSHSSSSSFSLPSLRVPNEILRRFRPQIKTVFSNSDFACGGRLYSSGVGDWQAMPQTQRHTILIDNRPTVELDYNAFHISMLYAQEGMQITQDPYSCIASDELRPVVKKLLLTALNARSIPEAVNSMNHQLYAMRKKPVLKERDIKFLSAYYHSRPDWRFLIERLQAAHPAIAHYFCTGAGIYLQRLDSEIMRNILLNLARRDIPCLPVHDSAIVSYFHENDLRQEMDRAYRAHFNGFRCGIECK